MSAAIARRRRLPIDGHARSSAARWRKELNVLLLTSALTGCERPCEQERTPRERGPRYLNVVEACTLSERYPSHLWLEVTDSEGQQRRVDLFVGGRALGAEFQFAPSDVQRDPWSYGGGVDYPIELETRQPVFAPWTNGEEDATYRCVAIVANIPLGAKTWAVFRLGPDGQELASREMDWEHDSCKRSTMAFDIRLMPELLYRSATVDHAEDFDGDDAPEVQDAP